MSLISPINIDLFAKMPRSFLVKKKGSNRFQRPDTEPRHNTATTPPQSVHRTEIDWTQKVVNNGNDKTDREKLGSEHESVDVISKNSARTNRQMSYRIKRLSNASAEDANALTSEEEDEQEHERQNKLIQGNS